MAEAAPSRMLEAKEGLHKKWWARPDVDDIKSAPRSLVTVYVQYPQKNPQRAGCWLLHFPPTCHFSKTIG